ncbi:uncharacterized protein LOC135120739 isoform X1 [Zophobas morio]|uniref:uncharacterized protein LOC135120739 isoform X1 n=1 Tax=Zophobas morio TaxID=2755281 RepID=UPI003083D5B2
MTSTLAKNTCSVKGCGKRELPMYRFPNPKTNGERFRKWVLAANNPRFEQLGDNGIYKKCFVCHNHFKEEDKILNSRLLRKTAVPSQNLPIGPSFATEQGIDAPSPPRPSQSEEDLIFRTPQRELIFMPSSVRKRVTPSACSPSTSAGVFPRSVVQRTLFPSISNGVSSNEEGLGVAPLSVLDSVPITGKLIYYLLRYRLISL